LKQIQAPEYFGEHANLAAEDFRTVQTPSFPYLLIPAVAVGLLAACGTPEPTEPVDPAAPESAQLEPVEMLSGRRQVSGQEAAQYVSLEYYR